MLSYSTTRPPEDCGTMPSWVVANPSTSAFLMLNYTENLKTRYVTMTQILQGDRQVQIYSISMYILLLTPLFLPIPLSLPPPSPFAFILTCITMLRHTSFDAMPHLLQRYATPPLNATPHLLQCYATTPPPLLTPPPPHVTSPTLCPSIGSSSNPRLSHPPERR